MTAAAVIMMFVVTNDGENVNTMSSQTLPQCDKCDGNKEAGATTPMLHTVSEERGTLADSRGTLARNLRGRLFRNLLHPRDA